MQLAFSAIKDAERVVTDLKAPHSGSVDFGLEEWAEELAAIGKRRNVLEKKLREIVLNFLRFDSMNSGKLPELQSRIASILTDQQRSQLAHLSADDTISKMNWTSLVKLVVKEWQIFQRLFGDREQFIRNCDVINDRYDAHAKNADPADFAMYRRSLAQIEDRLAKLQ